MKKSRLEIAISLATGISSATIPTASMSATLADGVYNMYINNTPLLSGGYDFGSDGAWSSGITFGCLPGPTFCPPLALYDDTAATPVNGKYAGSPNDGVQGYVGIRVAGGVITGLGPFAFDTIADTPVGNFQEYGSSTDFTGTIDGSGNITLTPTGVLGTAGNFPSLVDEAWNVDNFNGLTGSVANPPNANSTYDTFSTGSASNIFGTINGAAFDGTTAILVKGGTINSAWDQLFGAQYFEVWNVSFLKAPCCGPVVPIPATVWLVGSGLLGLTAVARRRKR